MKLYLDTHEEHHFTEHDECRSDCHRDCSKYSDIPALKRFMLSEDERKILWHTKVHRASGLYIRQIGEQKYVICNPTSAGRVFVLDKEALAFFEHFQIPHSLAEILIPNEPSAVLLEIFGLLLQGDILADSAKPYKHSWESAPSTLTAWLHVTNRCNLRCSYCYIEKSQETMSEDTAYRSVDAIFRSARKQHIQHIELKYAGGEASLSIEHVLAIHDYAQQLSDENNLSLSACILSNGVFLSQQAILGIKERGIGVMLSLDGIGKYHDNQRTFKNGMGSFKYVDRTIQKLLQQNLRPSISVTVAQGNIAGLPALIEYLLDQKLAFTLNYYRENPLTVQKEDLDFTDQQMIQGMLTTFQVIEQHLPRYPLLESLLDKADLAHPHRHACGVGQNYLVINQNGGIAKCQAAIQQEVTSIDADDPLQSLREDQRGFIALSVDEKAGCQQCLWRYWCAGGCPILTYQVTGRNDIQSPNCHIYQALFPEVLRLEALRLVAYETPFSFEVMYKQPMQQEAKSTVVMLAKHL